MKNKVCQYHGVPRDKKFSLPYNNCGIPQKRRGDYEFKRGHYQGDQWSPLQTNFGKDIVFSADLWYNGVYRRAMGFALCLCNTKVKLVIKQNDK